MARILLTGATGRVGRAFLERSATPEYEFALVTRDPGKLETVDTALRNRGTKTHLIQADLAEDGVAGKIVADAIDAMGGIDVLINNAAAFGFGPFADMAPERLDHIVKINLQAVLQLSLAALPALSASPHAALINIASTAGIAPVKDAPVYSATKAALIAFGKALREEASAHNIAVCTVIPGQLQLKDKPHAAGLDPAVVADAITAIIRDPIPARWQKDVLLMQDT